MSSLLQVNDVLLFLSFMVWSCQGGSIGSVRYCGECRFQCTAGLLTRDPCDPRACNGTLDLSFMGIREIAESSHPFDKLMVTEINLNNNHLQTLPGSLFHQSSLLQRILLCCNQLVQLDYAQFYPVANLSLVTLNNNNLTCVPPFASRQPMASVLRDPNIETCAPMKMSTVFLVGTVVATVVGVFCGAVQGYYIMKRMHMCTGCIPQPLLGTWTTRKICCSFYDLKVVHKRTL